MSIRIGFALAALTCLASCGSGAGQPDVKARRGVEGLIVHVPGGKTYTNCKWELNREFQLGGNFDLEPGEIEVPWSGFRRDGGARFSPDIYGLKSLSIDCDGPPNRTYVYLNWDK